MVSDETSPVMIVAAVLAVGIVAAIMFATIVTQFYIQTNPEPAVASHHTILEGNR